MDLKNNPHYQNGVFKGSNIIEHIEQTTFGTISAALVSKEQLVDDLKKNFGWDETHKDVAETLGMIDILKKELKRQSDEQPEFILHTVDVINVASEIGVTVSQTNLDEVMLKFPEVYENHPGIEWYLLVEHLINEVKNEK